jgi:hypothetical protein
MSNSFRADYAGDIIATEGHPMSWWERWRERQYQLAQGVDANLVRGNHQRFRLAFGLLVFAFLLGILASKFHLPSTLRFIIGVIVIAAVLVGFVLAAWARQEAAFLSKPDPEEPPQIFK